MILLRNLPKVSPWKKAPGETPGAKFILLTENYSALYRSISFIRWA